MVVEGRDVLQPKIFQRENGVLNPGILERNVLKPRNKDGFTSFISIRFMKGNA